MRRLVGLLALAFPTIANASPMTVVGEVVETHSRWTADGSRIVTEATVRTPDGDVVVSQLGGRAGGYGMRVFHGPDLLEVGMTVSVDAHHDLDLAQRVHVVVDRVRITGLPQGFVQTGPTKAGKYLFWESGCVFVTPDDNGTNQVVGGNEFLAITASINEWNSEVAGCSFMQIVEQDPVPSEVGRDNRNLIKFRDATWCRPAIGDDPPRCYSPSAAGITTAIFVDDATSDRDGAIVDADIELNGENFAIADDGQSTGTQGCKSEIKNTLTHELGHLLGLEHPCLAAGDPARTDGEGRPVPSCSQVQGTQCQNGETSCAGVNCAGDFFCVDTCDPVDPDGPGCTGCEVACASPITEATMFNFQDCGERKKQSLAPDDIDAICTIYPTAEDPNECGPVGGGSDTCCSATPPHPVSCIVGLGVVVLLLRPRRKNSRPR